MSDRCSFELSSAGPGRRKVSRRKPLSKTETKRGPVQKRAIHVQRPITANNSVPGLAWLRAIPDKLELGQGSNSLEHAWPGRCQTHDNDMHAMKPLYFNIRL
jgi:hypothetical protein